MKRQSKPLWGEGLFLKPQHFQRQDLYHEQRVAELGQAMHPYPWGVRRIAFDIEALAAGVLRITELSAIFPDGESISAPDQDGLPDPVDLSSFDDSGNGIVFSLALPHLRDHGTNFSALAEEEKYPVRYVQHNEATPDLYTNAIDFEMASLRKSLRLLSERDKTEKFVRLPVARVRANSTGGFEIDASFLPPLLTVRSSSALHQMLRRLLDILHAKADALYGYHREPSQNLIEFRSGDIASFWLLHTVNAAFASLCHVFHHSGLHPERLFQSMLSLAGGLLTFSKSYSLSDLPIYEHDNPGPAFFRLDVVIRELLETVISTRHVAISLVETKPSFHGGRLDSDKFEEDTAYYIGVSADMPPAELVEAVPLRFKVGAPDDVDKLVLSAMSGVKLMSAPQVPAPIPVRPGCYYFSIESRGSLYERMVQSRTITIYVPTVFKDLKLELFAVTR